MAAAPGALRFNTDSLKMELYDGNQWVEIVASSPDSQTGGARGVFTGGYGNSPAANSNTIDYVTISTTGNAIDFGDCYSTGYTSNSCASSTRGIIGGGFPANNVIQYITVSSTGNSQDFGDLTQARLYPNSCSSSTRGIFAGGAATPTPGGTVFNVIDYITISATGNAVDFGDSTVVRNNGTACASSTRGLMFGGSTATSPAVRQNVIDFITISTLGNAADFGDLTSARDAVGACSNSIRGLVAGGGSPITNVIEYITISTLGNAQDFGDLTNVRANMQGCASSTRGVWGGGYSPGFQNVIDYVSIMSIGNAIDFGDLTFRRDGIGALSNGHGGL
jgi:hypothetical protein